MARAIKYVSLSSPAVGTVGVGLAGHAWAPAIAVFGALLLVFLFLNIWYSTSDRRVQRLNLVMRNEPLTPAKPKAARPRRDSNPTIRLLRVVEDLRRLGRKDLADKVERSILVTRLIQTARSASGQLDDEPSSDQDPLRPTSEAERGTPGGDGSTGVRGW